MNDSGVVINGSKIITLDDSDPRYHLNIEDSDEYTRNIYPLHFSKRCHDSEDYEDLVKYEFPLISRCWGERYEHCAIMKRSGEKYEKSEDGITRPVIETGTCSCAKCAYNLYGPIEDTLGYARIDLTHDSDEASQKETLNRSDFKKQNQSTILDQTRIFRSDGLGINYRKPDVKACGSNMSVNKAGNGLEYNLELEDKYEDLHPKFLSDQNIEPFVSEVSSGIGSCFESCLGICLPNNTAQNWGYSTLCCVICALFLICLVSNAFLPVPGAITRPPIASYICLFGLITLCVCGSSTYSFFADQSNLPSFMRTC